MPGPLLLLAGAIFSLLAVLHAAYTLLDLRTPSRLVPADPAVLAAMQGTTIRLSRGGATMWQGWVGFNLSHSLGALLFGGALIATGWWWPVAGLPAAVLALPVAICMAYLALGVRYWFWIPTTGIGIATLACLGAWLLA